MRTMFVPVVFRAIDDFSRPIRNMQRNMTDFQRTMSKGATAMQSLYRGLGGNYGTLALGVGLYGIADGFKSIVREAANAEQTIASFTPMMGSVGEATKLFKELQKTAMSTPFEFPELAAATNYLLPITKGDIPATIKLLRTLGDTAGGSAEGLKEIAKNYSQIQGMGKGKLQDINQFTTWGIQIWKQLEKSTGKTQKELRTMQSEGTLTAEHFKKAFEMMTGSSGDYYNAMKIANETMWGQWSNFKDMVRIVAQTIGSGLLPLLKDYIKEAFGIALSVKEWAIQNRALISAKLKDWIGGIATAVRWAIRNFETIVTVLKYYAAALITAKVLTLAFTLATNISRIAMFLYNTAIMATLRTMIALNVNSGVASTILGGLAAVIGIGIIAWYSYKDSVSTATKASIMATEASIYQQTEIHNLFETLKKTTAGTQEYKDVLEKLKEISPDIVRNYGLELSGLNKLAQAERDLIELVKERALVQAYSDIYNQQIKDAALRKVSQPELLDYLESFRNGLLNFFVTDNEISTPEGIRDWYANRMFSQAGETKKSLDAEKIILQDKENGDRRFLAPMGDKMKIEIGLADGLKGKSFDPNVTFFNIPKVPDAMGF